MARYLVGIDFGTGGAKAAVIDEEGHDLGFAYEEYEIIRERPLWSEHEAREYWPIAGRLIRAALARAGVPATAVAGIAASSALPSMVMVDREGQPINRGYTLMDRRARDEVAWLKETVGEERCYELSAYRVEDHPLLVNLLWEKRRRPTDYARIASVLTIDGYITYKLTGRAVANVGAAAFYGLAYDIRTRRFDVSMLDEIGIDGALLPEVLPSEAIVGEVTTSAAEVTGLAPGTPVAAGQVDCNASWVGAGATAVGDIQSNLGTVGNFGIIHRDLDFLFSDIGKKLMSFPYTVESETTYITVPTTITGGQTLRYLRDTVGQAEREAERLTGISAYDSFTALAATAPVGCDGLVVLPYLAGERTPIWDADARAVVYGLSLHHGKGHLIRGFMEGVAYAMYDSFRLVREAGMTVNVPMVLNEGGAVSPLWRRIITDVFDVETAMVKRRTGAPFGDAVLAGVATGVFSSFDVTRKWVELVDAMEPDRRNHERYMELFEVYKTVYERTKDQFKVLSAIRSGE